MIKPYIIPHSTPEKLGISSEAVLKFIEAIESDNLELHTFKLLRHGQIATEGAWAPYNMEHPHQLFSLSKTVSATGIGLAVQEGLLTVDDLLIDIFPEYVTKEIAANMADLRVRHVLAMATGHDVDTGVAQREQPDDDWVKAFFDTPIVHPPGTFFLYNSGASFMLSAIIQKLTGISLLDYIRPRLLDPLGIDYAVWETNPRGMNVGASGMHMTTESIARLGLLFLQKGLFNGTRILTEEWVEEATSYHTNTNPNNELPTDWKSGYGYQMWRNLYKGSYRGDGACGQLCIILPDKDGVIAVTAGSSNMGRLSELINEYLIPAFTDNEPIVEAADASAQLSHTIARLAYTPPFVQAESPESTRVSGEIYKLEANVQEAHAVSFTFDDEHVCTFRIWDARGEHMIRCGSQEWIIGETIATEDEWITPVKVPWTIAASGTWHDERTYVMTWRFIGTVFIYTVASHFDSDQVSINYSRNVSFVPYHIPTLRGSFERS